MQRRQRSVRHLTLFLGTAAVPSLLLLSLLLLACSDDSGPAKPGEVDKAIYGELITPVYSYERDPVLSDAYQALKVDGNQVAHFAISWSQVEPSDEPAERDWSSFDIHVRQAREKDVALSMVLQIVQGDSVDVPAWIGFSGFGDATLRAQLAQFFRQAGLRAYGRLDWVWLGEGFDRYLSAHPEEEEAVSRFLGAMTDSLHRSVPDVTVGIAISPASLEKSGKQAWARAVRDSLDLVGLSVFPALAGGSLAGPDAALSLIHISEPTRQR
ncbi:MAG: hypothetical protein QUU85_18925, partial [Candidatus Eisenbacteria bacterium]|nr:hypothetical protein [Candidatus Eisenbacteria bacterium]